MPSGGGPDPFRFDRTWVFGVAPDAFWTAISEPGQFPRWWPWLRELSLSGDGLAPGGRAACEIRAPIPYSLRFTVEVVEHVPERLLDTMVTGDLRGPARLEAGPHRDGTAVRLAWEMEVRRPLLRMAARVGRPVMEWGHDWVVGNGVDQFRERALRVCTDPLPDRPPMPEPPADPVPLV